MTSSPGPGGPRIPPLPTEERDADTQSLLDSVVPPSRDANAVFVTLVRHPGLFRRWLPFAGKLLGGALPARDRELLILRTAWRCGCEYEWGHHVTVAIGAGISAAEVESIKEGSESPAWDSFDARLLQAVDELHDDARLGDETWQALAARYDDRQLIEVPMLVGHYEMVAFVVNSLGVQREQGIGGFDGGPDPPGGPFTQDEGAR